MKSDEPKKQKILIPHLREVASWGPDDPKIFKLYMFAKEITKYLDLSEKKLDKSDFLADRIKDKLESALMYYQLIMADDFDTRNISQQRTIYEGLYANLWSFYKGRVQNYVKHMGWDLKIFFCSPRDFDEESELFIEKFPDHKSIVEMAKKQRDAWQSEFARSRNISEHSGDFRDGTPTYENKHDAMRIFAQVCWTAETIMAYFGSYKMKREWNIVEVAPGTTIFDENKRYIIEHAIMTSQRNKNKK